MRANQSVPFAAFPLAWRFTPERTACSTPEALARLHPFTDVEAGRVADEAVSRCTIDESGALAFRSDEPPGAVRRSLLELPVLPDARIIVSWDRSTALATDWDSFVSYWDDFCYPASDDVTIWSPNGDWTLCYRHYEVFQFRRMPRVDA